MLNRHSGPLTPPSHRFTRLSQTSKCNGILVSVVTVYSRQFFYRGLVKSQPCNLPIALRNRRTPTPLRMLIGGSDSLVLGMLPLLAVFGLSSMSPSELV
ncbi:hypothetical protein PLICRDRAFT_530682 [Plicaturopsis crispa FD-325 SS-3]|nr:hypothetical protein PLICRDRAFT_530682 [Plicaturopsis crispa FD-325 SS-3]